MKRYFGIIILTLLTVTGYAQKYALKQYRVEEGLPSDIIKSSAQDSLRYFWAATDEGFVKYDGINFTSYRKATHSNYAKGLLATRSGKLLAFGDLDLLEIRNLGDTVIFKRLCPVSRIANDSSLSYPKLLFEDAQGTIWVSESQAVVKLDQDYNLEKRYSFDITNRSTQFLRSFSFFEDNQGVLYTVSLQGNVFRYNTQRDAFEPIAEKFPAHVETITKTNQELLIGTSAGLHHATLPQQGGYGKPKLQRKIPFVSYIAPINDSSYFVATRGNQHFIFNRPDSSLESLEAVINNVNHVYLSTEGDMWISGNEGLMVMRQNFFQMVNPEVKDFIESIAEDPDSRMVFYATSQTLFLYDRRTAVNKKLLEIQDGYFQSIIYTKEGIWVANSFKVYFISMAGKILREFDFAAGRKFITALSKDKNDNIWLTIPGNTHAYRIDKNFVLSKYRVAFESTGVINIIREGSDGMYIASAGKDSYLYFMSPADTVFRNISLPLAQSMHNEFNATDLVVHEKNIWLATTEGLLKYDYKNIQLVQLNEPLQRVPVKSVFLHPDNKLLASTAYGMIFYDIATSKYDLFNESSGLLSNTITPQGFFVGKYRKAWIGTAKGLCVSIRPLVDFSATPKLVITRFTANAVDLPLRERNEIPFNSFLTLEASSITFPENEVVLQYRILPDTIWTTTTQAQFSFTANTSGAQQLEMRSKKNGPYTWSESTLVTFSITPPFWERPWFYLAGIVAGLMLVAITITGVNARNRYKTLQLQRLVDERTNELKQRNEELVQLNDEKNNLIGIVAHDLKSPLRQIMGLFSLINMTAKVDPETADLLTMANDSTKRLDNMIMKILDTDALDSKEVNVTIESIDLSGILSQVADRYKDEAAVKNIVIHKNIAANVIALADKNYSEQVLENLISNAIKFSPFDKNIYVNLTIVDKKVLCEIKDEGPGLTEADKKKLFGKYQKLSARPTGSEISTGLGLSIVKKFMIAMQGEIWCESEAGKGASFFVSFKIAE